MTKIRRRLTSGAAACTVATGLVLGLPSPASATTTTIPCASGHFCGQDTYFNRIDYYKCGIKYPVELWGAGEAYNHQTPPRPFVTFYDANDQFLSVSGPGSWYQDWGPVYSLVLC